MAQAKTIYTVNLSAARNAPRNRRAARATRLLKGFVRRHASAPRVTISSHVNNHLWGNGARSPPRAVTVQVLEEEDEAFVELADRKISRKEDEEEKEAVEREATSRTGALPADVEAILEDGTVDEAKDALKALNRAQFQAALDFEKEHQNRKTLIRFIESNMN